RAHLLPRPWRAARRWATRRRAERPARGRRLPGGALMATTPRRVRGYGLGTVDTVLSVDAVERAAADLGAGGPSVADLDALVAGAPLLAVDDLVAGYGAMEILHGVNLRLGAGQSLCLIGPNGAGKSTVLHSIYGFTNISGGSIKIDERD